DGIRDRNVTGVQTCALPISWSVNLTGQIDVAEGDLIASVSSASKRSAPASMPTLPALIWASFAAARSPCKLAISRKLGSCHGAKIGRASCRERVERTERDGG